MLMSTATEVSEFEREILVIVKFDVPNLIKKKNLSRGTTFSAPLDKQTAFRKFFFFFFPGRETINDHHRHMKLFLSRHFFFQ